MSTTAKILIAGVLVIAAIWAAEHYLPSGPSDGPRTASDITPRTGTDVSEKERKYERAKEFVNPSGFINTAPFTIASLVGAKVILVDFWTYSCINCQRTLPYLNRWQELYADKGLAIVGVHTPEFEFEKDIANVRTAVAKFGITYPVVLDNDYGTWRAYQNQYWPRKYLIDTDGFIVYDHIGEGDYDETERKIQELLAEHMARHGTGAPEPTITEPPGAVDVNFGKVGTPETYFGANRNGAYLGNVKTSVTGRQTLTMSAPAEQKDDVTYLAGEWEFTDEFARCIRDCRVRIRYSARQVNIVAEAMQGGSIKVIQDGTASGSVSISGATLYRLVDDTAYGDHQLELEVPSGVDLYAFTFG